LTLSAAVWAATSNPTFVSILSIAAVTPTRVPRQFWARAELHKAVYTPTPIVVTPTAGPEQATQPVELSPAMLAELVEGAPESEEAQPETDAQEPAPEITYSGNKYILVDISEQHLYAYENGELLYSFVASTGMNSATAIGNFAVQSKIPNAYGSTWDIWMPNWLGIYWSGGLENGIHALPILPNGGILWEGFLGRPISYGCVVLGTYDSSLLFDWAEYGTPVDIQW
jgi:lipoprotein-anchoring transpeptidase ErfK/SrfK